MDVFSYLSPKDILRAGAVCREFRGRAEEPTLWTHLFLTDFEPRGDEAQHIAARLTSPKEMYRRRYGGRCCCAHVWSRDCRPADWGVVVVWWSLFATHTHTHPRLPSSRWLHYGVDAVPLFPPVQDRYKTGQDQGACPERVVKQRDRVFALRGIIV